MSPGRWVGVFPNNCYVPLLGGGGESGAAEVIRAHLSTALDSMAGGKAG